MRCMACNHPLSPNEIIWDEVRKTHEELCKRCRREGEVEAHYQADFFEEEEKDEGNEDSFFEESN